MRAHEDVLFGPNGLMDALTPGALHISLQHHQRGAALSGSLRARTARPALRGRARLWPAQRGRGGPAVDCGRPARPTAVATARPLLEPLSRGISVVGSEPRQAHALKLGGNFLISAMIHSLSEGICLR